MNEINVLKGKLKQKDYNLDDKTLEFIKETYPKVISEVINEDQMLTGLINYGPISKSTLALNNALVLGFRYDEFNQNGLSDEEWEKNYLEQIKMLETFISNMERELSQKLGIICNIIKYDEFSVQIVSIDDEQKSIS